MLRRGKGVRIWAVCERIVVAGIIFATLVGWAVGASAEPPSTVERWGLWEATFEGPADGNPYLDVRFHAEFRSGEKRLVVPGFYDGGHRYKLRFSPPEEGRWEFTTSSNVPALNGRRGALIATAPGAENHGPVVPFNTYYLRYADGTPYHQFGTTCYAWVHQPEELQEQTLKTLAASPFNKIRFCVFPKSYVYNENDPERYPFVQRDDGTFDFDRPDPVFWAHFEKRILDLQRLGIQADIILWHPYDRWGFSRMSDEQDDRYLRYCIARLAAFRNVWWSLANEYDFMTEQPGRKGPKQFEDWDRFFQILQNEDPYGRMRGIHNGRVWYDHTKPWVTHASLQSSDMRGGIRYRERYRKPVIYDECRYEGNVPQGWGNLTPQEMTQRFWLGTLSGCYVGHGETYLHPQDILWWSKGGVLHGKSPARIAWLKRFMAEEAPPFHELKPLGDDQGRFILGKPGEFYLVYCFAGQSIDFELPGKVPYKRDVIDPWAMTRLPEGTSMPGRVHLTASTTDLVYCFEKYSPGERMRPTVQPTATATEGLAPLVVQFTCRTAGTKHWDFGDGIVAEGENPTHTFTRPGAYEVVVVVTQDDGTQASGRITVAVDAPELRPLIVAACSAGETPPLHIQSPVSRGPNGEFVFPVEPPFGWVDSGNERIVELGGLRSFTIAGWLKPESFSVGSGGNRIIFWLNHDRAGVDLVYLADGRLRLAVNEWPDRVQNDSSPGKLIRGRWTFCAVTYDAGKATNNVAWYFSDPVASPEVPVEVHLDRRTTYPRGAVGTDVGPLAIGNFNRTLRSAGLDRQFRGSIARLVVYGSRITGRGALDAEALQRLTRYLPSGGW